jgi:hypothetical protein
MLAEFPEADLQVQVVWEPVLQTDVAAPLTRVLGLLEDRRVIQYWDPDLVVSADLVRAAREDPARYGLKEPFPPDFIAWDLLAVFGKSARWEGALPVPAYYGGPVVQVMEEAKTALSAELAGADALRSAPASASPPSYNPPPPKGTHGRSGSAARPCPPGTSGGSA